MYTSKLKLTLHWLLITVAFYIFWALAYLILVKFAMSQIDKFSYSSKSIWTQITASDIFWFAMFIFGMAIVIFVIKKAMQFSPNAKIAALIYAILIILSVGILVNKLLETNSNIDMLPHLIINGVFLVPLVLQFLKKGNTNEVYDEEQDEIDSSY